MANEGIVGTNFALPGHVVSPEVRLTLALLGPPQVLVNGRPVIELRGQRLLALLAYLALEAGRAHRRDMLAALFWPDEPEKQSFQNLRQTLVRLRRALDDDHADPPHLLIEPQTIRFNRGSDYWLDVETFRALLVAAERHPHRRLAVCPACLSQLARAVEICRGELLAHLHPTGSPAFDEWLLIEREQLGQQVCAALHALGEARLAQGEHRAAAGYARQLLRLEPWDETAQRRLLCSLAQSEGRNAALGHYQAFRRALLAELGVEPEDKTVALTAAIRAGTFHGPPCAPAAVVPTPLTPLIGRQPELQRISEGLAGRERRLLTLYGPGGCGKTRLALEVAVRQAALWRAGVWFIPAAEAPTVEALLAAVASAVGFRPSGQPVEASQLLAFLRPKELLLILDSLEHLLPAASPLLEKLVSGAPEVRVLVTSRTRLNVQGEWALRLDGLKLPAEEAAGLAGVGRGGCADLLGACDQHLSIAHGENPG